MSSGKPNKTTWKSELNQSDLEELIDPTNQEEIESDTHTVMKIITIAKKLRTEAYGFSPSKMKKEKRIW